MSGSTVHFACLHLVHDAVDNTTQETALFGIADQTSVFASPPSPNAPTTRGQLGL